MQADLTESREFAVRSTAAWCSQDAASVAAFYSAGGSLSVNDSAPAVGRSAITEVVRSLMTAFPDMRVAMDELLVQDDRAEYHWTLICTTVPGGTGQSRSHQWLRALADWSGWTHRILAGPLRQFRLSPAVGLVSRDCQAHNRASPVR
jgi:SnoaL-like protein